MAQLPPPRFVPLPGAGEVAQGAEDGGAVEGGGAVARVSPSPCLQAWQARTPEIVVHVKHVGQQRFRGSLLHVKILHLLRHKDCLPGDLFARPSHL